MPEQTQVSPPPPPAQAPPPPAIAGGSGGQTSPVATTPSSELLSLTYQQLRARLNELQNQRQTLAGRREALADGYEAATGANREGIGARLQTLDNNIVMYETEIAAVGRAMAQKAPSRQEFSGQASNPNNNNWSEDDVAGAMFGTFLGTALLTVLIMRRFVRRKYGRMGAPAQPAMIQSNERLDRIEQAVDTIAVEIERVSENQRFMTRLMTETQLGATLNDVRKSTELAKSAAEGG
ncbi:MAG TPA: hypothetical protein VFO55_02235 [Gemmatimonadaceae bacterium]|nr:hypothetical protein [Gemmatimonadaceae bacterium]